MVTAKGSPCQQFSAWNPPRLEQNTNLPYFPSSTLNSASHLRGLNSGPEDAFGGFSKLLPSCRDFSYRTENPHSKSSHLALTGGLKVIDKPVDASFAPQKRFLIFDQSGNDTRLFLSPSFSPGNGIFPSKTPTFATGPCEKLSGQVNQQYLVKPIVEEKWDENNLSDGEGDMREDSEEIDALLYSDSDDDDSDDEDDDDDEIDEVTSTRHTPFDIEEKLLEEKVASCDGSPKRQRLLNGKYKKASSFGEDERPVKRAISCNYEDDLEHSSFKISSYDDDDNDGIDSGKRETKVKIRQTLKMLEHTIPGLGTNDPLSIIDKAIAYLKSMKTEAESLGFDYSEPESTNGSSGPGH